MVTCALDGTLVLWRFNVSAMEADGRGRLLVPVQCRLVQFSAPPNLGIAVPMPDDSWTVFAIVSGVVLSVLRGDRSELFGHAIQLEDSSKEEAASSVVLHDTKTDPITIESIPVICHVKKPLEVTDLMPIRQEVGIYSWESIANWAAPPLPNEAAPESFYMDTGEGETGTYLQQS